MIERRSGFTPSGVYYEDFGAGDAVVFCHGLGGNHAVWFQQVPLFARTYRVITWDHRGFGRSPARSRLVGPVVDDLEEVCDAVGLDRVHIAAQSMGGWTAMGFTLRHPARVRTLVLADTFAGVYTDEALEAFRGRAPAQGDELAVVGDHPALGDRFRDADPAAAFLYQQLNTLGERPPRDEVIGVIRSTVYDLDDVRALRVPVLFVVGSDDLLCPPPAVKSIAALIDGARMVEIAGAGHSPYFEDAAAWNDAVLQFLEEHR
jgi:pimeloyl-ACP methyl ester carboxylesterase